MSRPDASSETDPSTGDGTVDLPAALAGPVERSFTCTVCGYATTHAVAPLDARVGATCANCGDWTVQTASDDALVDAAEAAAAELAGDVLTERQALAYLLRDVAGFSRQAAADVVDASPSNVDNLQRRGREKVADARRVVAALDAVATDDRGADGAATVD